MIITQSKSPNGALTPINFHYPQIEPTTQALDPGKILVSFLFSPINPQDLLVIAGRYPVKPSYNHEGEPVLGYDGVARVEAVGSNPVPSSAPASEVRPGDLVVPRRHGLGTWRSQAVLEAADVIRLTPTNDLIGASLLRMAFLPAYLLVEDVRALKPGDWIVQNVGSGTIARLVAQFARLKGVHTVSIVRDRDAEALESLKAELLAEGASVVISESDLRERGIEAHPKLADAAGRKRVVLAIDGVFGEPGERLAFLLSHGGTFVNYGSLGGAEGVVRLSQRLLFWSEIKFQNFRLSERLGHRTPEQQESLLLWFQDLLARGALVTPKVRRIQAPASAGNQNEFEHNVNEAVSSGSGAGIGHVKPVLEFKRTLVTA
ncbi:enoyl-[acyl-carrier-protein] reductase, mitochondrial [Colletotrichum spaethianum]|uniref:enoyl-[acyl-carrier-protein] reductase n=1 Tax=Colletotrichum spaethianum TaxID=700344 RepID=A0AA37LDL9_9PEZI|nr:enoyl-[acyl-carrier-protein] reductase, mitochondrial [Colletotrichum spaethianum]GKT45444.1 enoyl-[acyl-carrier-protein] reductase, mitochondrial [Colletotrichum spaethianum]